MSRKNVAFRLTELTMNGGLIEFYEDHTAMSFNIDGFPDHVWNVVDGKVHSSAFGIGSELQNEATELYVSWLNQLMLKE